MMSRMARRIAPLALVVLCFVLLGAVRCYPPDTRAVVFIQGLYTTLDAGGTQSSFVEEHRFDYLKAAFLGRGYRADALLDFSYNGGTVASDGTWAPRPYACEDTDRAVEEHVQRLEMMVRDYRRAHRDAHFALVGHSLGGYVAFHAAAREARRPEDQKLHIDVVVTLDAPLKGVSADKGAIINLISCEKTYAAGGQLAADRLDARTPDVRARQATEMAEAGIRLATLGNVADCLLNTGRCLPGQGWIDDSETQFLDGQAAVSLRFDIVSGPFESHEVILVHPPAVQAVVEFVGAP